MPTKTSTKKIAEEKSLYLSWRLRDAKTGSAKETKDRLAMGERLNLYRLCSWVVAGGEARALLSPSAPLNEIAAAIGNRGPENRDVEICARWIANPSHRAALIREIEIVPVQLGLARRPEEWPYSSAASD